MSQRKLARKREPSARPNLRLVKPPKPRRRRRFKIGRAFRGLGRRKYAHRYHLHAYEDELVLSTLRERGGYGSVGALLEQDPGRWRPTYLKEVFKRLRKQHRLTRRAHVHHRSARYDIVDAKRAP